jgi:hypothetical protein
MGAVEKYQPPQMERLALDTVRAIAKTDLIPRHLRGNVDAIVATILKGRSLGLDDMSALTAIHFIEGKPTLSAETMVLLARRSGHSITGDFGEGAVTVKGKRGDTGDAITVTWTIAMAQRAGLAGKDNWKKYPEAMLWARAASQLCRMLFADVLAGAGYTPDEVELTPEEKVAADIGEVRPPVDNEAPDDTPPLEGHVLEGEVVDESAGDPEADAEAQDGRPVAPAVASEPGSPADVPATDADGQGSIFGAMAEKAQKSRRQAAPQSRGAQRKEAG